MRTVDRALGWCLVLLGCIHNFVAAPSTYDRVSSTALWFVTGGLALWYAGFLNLVRAYAPVPTPLLRPLCIVTNVSMLTFVLTFAATRGTLAAPASLALIGSVTALTIFSLRASTTPPSVGMGAP